MKSNYFKDCEQIFKVRMTPLLQKLWTRYYKIRAIYMWGIGCLLAIMLLMFWFSIKHSSQTAVGTKNGYVPYETKQLPELESRLKNKKECYLCGENEKGLMGYYKKFDDLGIICINTWYILDLQVRNRDDAGNLTGPRGYINQTWTGTGEGNCFFNLSPDGDRGIVDVSVEYGENSRFDISSARKKLCQDCLDKVRVSMEYCGKVDSSELPHDICLLDFQTLELYSVQRHQEFSYYIRDYYVQIDNKEERLDMQVIYAPILENGKKQDE